MLASIQFHDSDTEGKGNRNEWQYSRSVWHRNQGSLAFAFFQGCEEDFCALDREWQDSGVNVII